MIRFNAPCGLFKACAALLFLSSCGIHFHTQGLPDKTSNYVVTNKNDTIKAQTIEVKRDEIIADQVVYQKTEVSAVKRKKDFYVQQNGDWYNTVVYGKLRVLSAFGGYQTTFNTSTSRMTSSPSIDLFLQKPGDKVFGLDSKTLMELTKDNPPAYRKANAARIYRTLAWVMTIAAIGGTGTAVLTRDANSSVSTIAFTAGMIGFPGMLISIPIANKKVKNAVKIYNR
ncbi:MAG TPA: hypothetical protein VK541_23645 [Pedobacter sp.]|uniref:hypothetical protein n=1 Tax=Pedobacter sp. TaxID=1411316 RepID=UPI002BD0F2DC|nr:hypothetical protein [Pedobacter sp.]HMI05503.1 hypothetical protein [Pedobacter sp.]